MTSMTRRAFLTAGVGSATALLAGCGEEQKYEVDGWITAKHSDGEIQANKASDWTFSVETTDGQSVWVPVSEYEYGRYNVGDRIWATGTDGNVWAVAA